MWNNEAKVTVYIPCFNAERYIQLCLEGVFRQTYPIDEVLVIDDASSDKTAVLASKFPVKIIRHAQNMGLVSARNTAIKNAKSEFLASLDADCIPENDWLQRLMTNFSSKVAGVGGRLFESHIDSPVDLWRSIHMKQHWGKRKSKSISFLFGSNCVFKRDILRELNGYNEQYFKNNYEDVDASRRIKKIGYTLVYEPHAVAHHIKKDDIHSLLAAFWNWNFDFHRKDGYYENNKNLYLKIKENIGLANRFLEEDYRKKRIQLIYLDFLLCISLSFKDFLFFHNRPNFFDMKDERGIFMPFFHLVDLSLFYHLDSDRDFLRTFIRSKEGFSQNFLSFLLVNGEIMIRRFGNDIFLEELFKHFFGSFMDERPAFSELLVQRLLLMLKLHKDWGGFLKKGHPNLDGDFLRVFSENFQDWFGTLSHQYTDIFNIIKVSQSELIKNGGNS